MNKRRWLLCGVGASMWYLGLIVSEFDGATINPLHGVFCAASYCCYWLGGLGVVAAVF